MGLLSSSSPPGKYVFIEAGGANECHPTGLLLLFLHASGLLEQILSALPNLKP
jgi:hypothetical protein